VAKLSSSEREALPDSAFAHVEPGHAVNGKTPDKYRHFPVHDAAHVRDALARAGQGARFAKEAMPKIKAAAKKFGVQHDAEDTGRSLESLFPEVRFIADRPEVRRAADGDGNDTVQHILGYASVFGKVSRRLGNFHEKVMPTAFAETLKHLDDTNIVCRYNHKDDMVLGTSQAGTLRLEADERGLKYDVIPPHCRADVLEYVQRGDVRYSSFAFRVPEPGTDDTWGESEYGLPMRSLHNVELVDVAPVLDPAYKDTSATARNLAGAIESLASWVDGDPSEVRSILEAGQASRLFRRTDRSSLPALDNASAANREESRVLDDPAIALRRWAYADEPAPAGDTVVPEEDRTIRSEEEIRAAMKPKSTDQLCMRFHHGEPCVRPAGHAADGPNSAEGGHAGLCWGRHDGLPCNQHEGHEPPHTPLTVASRSEEGDEPEKRAAETTTLSGPEALRKMFERGKTLTELPD
jgi:uncharacterized protein